MSERVLVIGGGITGLVCAFDLQEADRDVLLLDAGPRAGGVVGTRCIGGYRFEDGPNTVPGSARHLLPLCTDLGLEQQLISSRPEAEIRYLYHRGGLVALPRKPQQLLTSSLLSLGGKLRLLSEPLRRWREPEDQEPSFLSFLERRIGPEAARRLGGAFVRGIHAAEASELGAASAFPRVFDAAREHGGIFRALKASRRSAPVSPVSRGALVSFPGGFGELIEALGSRLGPRLRTGSPVERLEQVGSGWRVHGKGFSEEAAEVVLTTPAGPTARLLRGLVPDADLQPLEQVHHADVTVVHVGLEPEPGVPGELLPPGFGFLVPPEEEGPDAPRVLGLLFPSNIFPGRAPEGCATLTAIYRTADRQGMEEEALVQGVLEDLERALGERPRAKVAAAASVRWPEAIPRYGVGHRDRMDHVLRSASTLRGLTLAGNWHGGISIDDRIAAGRAAAAEQARGTGKAAVA